jgi:hypothetical protein
MSTVVLGIVGVTQFTDYDVFKSKVEQYTSRMCPRIDAIVSTTGLGTNELVKKYATEKSIAFTKLMPDTTTYGNVAELVVNNDIVSKCTHVIVFWDKRNKVLKDLRDKTLQKNKNLMTFQYVPTPVVTPPNQEQPVGA